MPCRVVYLVSVILLGCCLASCKRKAPEASGSREAAGPFEEFLRLMNAGKNYMDQGDATNALATYKKAEALTPNSLDLRLNLANAHLMAGSPAEAVQEAEEALKLDPQSAAAWFIKGSAHLRLNQPEEAVKALENARRIDPSETATLFQLGVARMGLKQWDEAIAAFQEGLKLEPNRLHTAAHYLLGQSLLRAGRQEEAQKELLQHQAAAEGAGAGQGQATFERSKYTVAKVPFKLDQPEKEGIKVRFLEATDSAFGGKANNYSGPVGLIDPQATARPNLFVRAGAGGFRVLANTDGTFQEKEACGTNTPGNYTKVLVGDLQNDRFEDVIVLGTEGSHLFKFETNGVAVDFSEQSGLRALKATDGLLIDLDFTGKLDLAVISNGQPRVFRQFGPLMFSDVTSTSGIPAMNTGAKVIMENWNRDENMDLIVARSEGRPLLLEKKRGGPLLPVQQTNWTAGTVFAAADFDNDLRPDLAVWDGGRIVVTGNGGEQRIIEISGTAAFAGLEAFDYDNDGWLDLWAWGELIRVWRNAGAAGFQERTRELGLADFKPGKISEIHFADFDHDCDSDVVLARAEGGLRYLRNDGGNANAQVKVQLVGNRSNASGIGCRVEIETGGLRLIRVVDQLPVEIGVGKHQTLDSFLVHWFNWPQGTAHAPVDCKEPLLALELTIQEGSCPYVYVWDGARFRFVTDILGAAPLGLPLAEGRYIEADPEEYVWLGDESNFVAKDGSFHVRITEELREALYLDEARLVVVDHELDTEVHATDKLLPGPPYPQGELKAFHREKPLRKAETLDGIDVTEALSRVDGHRVSPARLRSPQLRGLAEPHGVILDFGELDPGKPLALVMNGWLKFGGGMANIAASHDTSLPYPFPVLEAELGAGQWEKVELEVGAPAGKTKTIIVQLGGKLPAGAKRLRLTQAFEIHWDRIALLEQQATASLKILEVAPKQADLHFRGFSKILDLPRDWPLTPDYQSVTPNWFWTIIPGGWCTRYGDVRELIEKRDEGLLVMNSGDELSLQFDQADIPLKKPGMTRQFFLYVDGWDKDSDFHVAAGTTVGPLPWHAMNCQDYGKQPRPPFPSDPLHQKYNTRWVDGKALKQIAKR